MGSSQDLFDADSGEIAENGKALVVDWISQRGLKPCPACNSHTEWILLDHVALVPIVGDKRNYPAVVLACDGCGFFRIHGAFKVGLARKG